MSDYQQRTHGGQSFVGSDIGIYQAITIAKACKLYAASGMIPNRSYTPTKMLQAAGGIVGKTYKRGQHMQAHDDLIAFANQLKAQPRKDD